MKVVLIIIGIFIFLNFLETLATLYESNYKLGCFYYENNKDSICIDDKKYYQYEIKDKELILYNVGDWVNKDNFGIFYKYYLLKNYKEEHVGFFKYAHWGGNF